MRENKSKIIFFCIAFLILATFTVSAQSLGDVNGDGSITIVDALVVAQKYVGLNPPVYYAHAADVDGNGTATIVDALIIAQYYVGLITEFPGAQTGTEPVADFTISNIVPGIGVNVTFDGTQSSDPDGTIVSYEWDFDDGTTGSGAVVTHSFNEMKDFRVSLTVTDNSGMTDGKKNRVFVGRPSGWTEETHHKSTDGNYDLLFDDTVVQRLDISITPAVYQAMENDLKSLDVWGDDIAMYGEVTIKHNGKTWWHVGMRYKGNSTLTMAMQKGHKLPFRLSFDKYEDQYPEIDDQRFYGFQKMTFGNNWFDASFIRDKVASDIFRDGGVPTARGTFCRVYVDSGNGPVYWGLYSMLEDPSDEMLKAQFEDSDGNLYKPEGDGADLTFYSQDAMVKKTNEDDGDWSDVEAFVNALHAPRSNAAAWRAGLESVFDVNAFLKWLAINTALISWDSYGIMAQNYYLYQNLADNGRLVWFPWDLNMSMDNNAFGWGQVLELSLNNVTDKWPAIRYIIDDPVYKNIYHQELATAIDGCLNPDKVINKMQTLHNLIRPYTVGAEGEIAGNTFLSRASEFDQALTTLKSHIQSRQTAVRNYLNSL